MEGCVWNVSKEDRLCEYCIVTACGLRVLRGKRRGYITGRMRKMGDGGEVVFDHSFYNAARTAAFRLAAEGKRFLVNNRNDGVHVERIK